MSTYSSRLRARLDPKHPCNRSFNQPQPYISDEILEREYNKKLLGGYNKKNLCNKCNVALPKTNICDNCS
jgi:hypothetical protein